MKITLTKAARADLQGILRYIAQDNLARAQSFVEKLYSKCLSLDDMWDMFPVIGEQSHIQIRRRPSGKYVILYKVSDHKITVLSISHASRKLETLLNDAE